MDKQFQDMRKHFESSEFELKNKIHLLEKQLRIRRSQLVQIKEESGAEIKRIEQANKNLQVLVTQEQILHKSVKDELQTLQNDRAEEHKEQGENILRPITTPKSW